jgi:hypothetical protein
MKEIPRPESFGPVVVVEVPWAKAAAMDIDSARRLGEALVAAADRATETGADQMVDVVGAEFVGDAGSAPEVH